VEYRGGENHKANPFTVYGYDPSKAGSFFIINS
jgi:hypothetical protein